MLIGFERITADLKPADARTAEVIATLLLRHHGKDKAIKNEDIRAYCSTMAVAVPSAIKVRKIIHELRVHGVVKRLVATSKGYYISSNPSEIEDCIDSLAQRQRSIQEVQDAMQSQLKEFKKGPKATLGKVTNQPELFD